MSTGEAGFAASGTTIRTLKGGATWIASGGAKANIYFSPDYANSWQRFTCPILQGEPSSGIFSIDFYNKKKGVAVGGNYLKDKENANNVLLSDDGGASWIKPEKPVGGFRSGVIYLSAKILIATGTSGTDLSQDGGVTWHNISDQSFNVVQKAKKGRMVLLAGNKGALCKLTF